MSKCHDCYTKPFHPDKKCCFNCGRDGDKCNVVHCCGEDCTGWEPKKQTNADRIRAMSDKELADVIMCPMEIGADKDLCANNHSCTCVECSLRWLQEPAKEEV